LIPAQYPSGPYFPEHHFSAMTAEVGAILAATGIAIAPVAAALVRRFCPARPAFVAKWGLRHAAQIVLLAVVLLLGIGFVHRAAAGDTEAPPAGLRDLALTALVLAACCALAAVQASRLDPEGVRALGFRRKGNLRAAVAGVLAYGMLLPAFLGVGLLWPWVVESLGAKYEPQVVLEKLTRLEPGERPIALLLGCAVMPFLEEVLFRGYLQPLFAQKLPGMSAVVATSLVFACLHGTGAFLPIFVLSLVLGGIMLRTERLFASWSVHALHNGLMFLLIYR
jgi:membrane protease YdiL (CAAX protease family)